MVPRITSLTTEFKSRPLKQVIHNFDRNLYQAVRVEGYATLFLYRIQWEVKSTWPDQAPGYRALYYDVLRYIDVYFLAGKYILPQIRSRRTLAAWYYAMSVVLRVGVFRDGDGENAKTLLLILPFWVSGSFSWQDREPDRGGVGRVRLTRQCWLSTTLPSARDEAVVAGMYTAARISLSEMQNRIKDSWGDNICTKLYTWIVEGRGWGVPLPYLYGSFQPCPDGELPEGTMAHKAIYKHWNQISS
jgi:hypothetical protein